MKVAVIGAGYVGLVTGVGLAQRSHHVVCHDINPAQLRPLMDGKAPFFEPGLDNLLQAAVKSKHFAVALSLPEALTDSDVSIIAVGTPSTKDGIDLGGVRKAAEAIGRELPKMKRYHTVAVKSTVVPGTTDTLVKDVLEKASGLKAGKDFGLGMVPEFLREGNAVEDFMNPDRIVIGGIDERTQNVLAELFAAPCPIIKTPLRNAEMIKYAANALFATLISFSNEIAGLCEKVPGLSEEQVMEGLHLDRRWRPSEGQQQPNVLTYLRGGIGFGGSCFPKDIKALREFAAAHNAPHLLLDAVLATNEGRTQAVVELLQQALGPVKGKRIVVAGLAFKENTDDIRESPGVRIVNALCRAGANVVAHDPMVDGNTVKFDGKVDVAPTIEAALRAADACVIATRWPQYIALNWAVISENMARPVLLDGRHVVAEKYRTKPVIYLPIGSTP